MSDEPWREGGDKPNAYGVKCAICGETVEAQTRDYYYRMGEDGRWEKAHRKCVESNMNGYGGEPGANAETIGLLKTINQALQGMSISLAAIAGGVKR